MTTNQTIDGVSRADLQAVYDELTDWKSPVAQKLRALLDKTEADIPASVPRGDPVAWRVTGRGGLTVTPQYPKWAVGERGLTITPLYAEPPASVAEQLIERLAQRFPDLENMYTAEVFADWLRAELNPSL